VKNVATLYDFYATVLHLLGLDHERLTDVSGHVNKAILA